MKFYVGLHHPNWLEQTDAPACVSVLTLMKRKKLPNAKGEVLLDSGAFTQISQHGEFILPAKEYANLAARCVEEMNVTRAAIQDWMCEPFVLAKTGLTVAEHQKRTIESLCELRYHAPDVDWMPVLQGYYLDDYLAHFELYEEYEFDLHTEPVVGVGSICRRQGTRAAKDILSTLAAKGLRLHGFGLKETALKSVSSILHSADSMAWSFRARKEQFKLPGCVHKTCANCLKWALKWTERITGHQAPSAIQVPLSLSA